MELAFVTVGVIVNTHGLKGEVRVLSRTERPDLRFVANSVLKLRRPGEEPTKDLRIVEARRNKQFWLLKFADVPSIEEAEKLKGQELCIAVEELPELAAGGYYIYQLVGLQVVADTGETLGTLKEVLTPGANDVYVVQRGGEKDVLIPAIKDCILDVNLAEGRMTVHLLPGLLEDDNDGENSRQ